MSHVNILANSLRTSDELNMQMLGVSYSSHRRNLTYPYINEDSSNLDFGAKAFYSSGRAVDDDIKSSMASFSLAKKFSEQTLLSGALGINSLHSKNKSKDIFTPQLSFQYYQKKSWGLMLNIDRSFLFETAPTLAAAQGFIDQWTYHIEPSFIIFDHWKFKSSFKLREISDNNQQTSTDISLMYAIFVWPTWFKLGVGYEHNRNKINTSYWSPRKFESFGVRIELSRDLIKKVNLSLGLNLNKLREENVDYGSGIYLNMGIRFGDRNKSHFKLNYEYIKSIQANSEWKQKAFQLQWNGFF